MTGRFFLTAASSGSGKTLLTCGILHTLMRKGIRPASFKCGPDYIDPMFHSRVIGSRSRNLDTFFAGRDTVRWLLWENSRDCDLAVLEGVMGYYDGIAGTTVRASAWDVADATDTPAVFIVNCKGMSVSVIPYIKGFLEYKENSHIKAVILNRISPMLYPRLKALIESSLPVKAVGYVPELKACRLESRHLGLVLPEEIGDLRGQLDILADTMEETIDWEALLEIAGQAPEIRAREPEIPMPRLEEKPIRVGVARDEAFCFFYEDNFRILRKMGVEPVWFSPIRDQKLPEDIRGLMFHGGYPELYAKQLSENIQMRRAVREAIEAGMPCMAECGGFMYLHERMQDMEGTFYDMAGVIPGTVVKKDKLGRFGYITLEGGRVFGKDTGPIPAHEFHYFDSDCCGESFTARKPESRRSWKCIHSEKNLLAGYPHLYFYGNPVVPLAFAEACLAYGKQCKRMEGL